MTDEDPERAPPLAKAGHFRAFEIYLAVERHKQLHGFQLRVADGKHRGIRDELVREVFDRMAQFFQGVPGSCVDPPPTPGKRIGCRYVPRRGQGQCATDCASSHDDPPQLLFRHPAISEQITNVLSPVKQSLTTGWRRRTLFQSNRLLNPTTGSAMEAGTVCHRACHA
jgi:hypothetical protein